MTDDIAPMGDRVEVGLGQPPEKPPVDTKIRGLFIFMHGSYGSLFTSKYATGDLDSQGRDKGIRAAMLVWGARLEKFSQATIDAAMDKLDEVSPDRPPNLQQFRNLCKALAPRKTFSQGGPRLAIEERPPKEVEIERRSDGLDWARMSLARHEAGQRVTLAALEMARAALERDAFKRGRVETALGKS